MSRARRHKGLSIRLGQTEVTKVGVSRFDRHDAFHVIMSLTWPQFFAGAVLVYLCVNLVFATAYFFGADAIQNARPGVFSDYFFFSVETLATVGYGQMAPATLYGHIIATIEIISGMLSLAVITSLVFARFSKPTARILFSRVAVIGTHDGETMLMMRVANERLNYIVEALASATLIRDVVSAEGTSMRRFFELKLERSRSPIFALSWTIMHRVDATSPLYGVGAEQMREGDMRIAIAISGTDETFAAGVTARHQYAHEDIHFNRRFVDVFVDGEHSRHFYLHLDRFHDLEPADPAH
ncbi:MAG: ion channel [Rudaea sp.]